MADDETKTVEPDRSLVAGGEAYEVGYFARKHEITIRIGNDGASLGAAARKLK
jgi:hypothetical protein